VKGCEVTKPPKAGPKARGKKKPSAASAAQSAAKRKPRGRPFQPGQSGNPAGRKPGSRNRMTLAMWADDMPDDMRAAIHAKLDRLALRGDRSVLKWFLDRDEPPRKARIPISWPEIKAPADAIAAMTAIEDKLSRGEISSTEAMEYSAVVREKREAIEQEIILREMRDLAQQVQTMKEGNS
jgi:uncharacterized protein DUF5681